MDWITGIQRAVDYIEEHLTEEIDYELAARESFSSVYHFQRVFSILCGYTLGEYPADQIEALRRKAVTEWLPSAGYELRPAPEFDIIHWFWKYGDEAVNRSRYVELWLPIEKKTR